MSKTLEAFSAWFCIKITDPKKCVSLRHSKVPFSDCKWKYVSASLSLVQILNAWSPVPIFFICFLHFASMNCFYILNFPAILGNWFFSISLSQFIYIPANCLLGLHWDSEYFPFPLKGLTFKKSLWFATKFCSWF